MKILKGLLGALAVAALATASVGTSSFASVPDGAISPEMLDRMRGNYRPTPADRALHNALNVVDINKLAANADARTNLDDNFRYRVPSKGITDQKSSGRCWLFTGLNVLRAQAINRKDLPEMEFSQAFNFFYDQLEKANLFLQTVIDTSDKPIDDRKVSWLFRNALSDGGQFTGVADIITKYGLVPAKVMPESYVTDNTSAFSRLLNLKLKEWGLELRKMAADGAEKQALEQRKVQMMDQVFRFLCQGMGVPPAEFVWKGKKYTPVSFYNELLGNDLRHNYVMFMNDPTRPYYKMYEIDLDRHMYDGENWTYLNVPMKDIKEMALASIQDSTAMYFSCDVGKFFNRTDGTLDVENYDYGAVLGTTFNMDKEQRILTGASGSSHAMTLVGVDTDDNGVPVKWLIENSWGNGANNGHLIASDKWMDEYLFRLVVERRFVPGRLQKYLTQKPVMLPCWDPMF